jgi:hypothetical protein
MLSQKGSTGIPWWSGRGLAQAFAFCCSYGKESHEGDCQEVKNCIEKDTVIRENSPCHCISA